MTHAVLTSTGNLVAWFDGEDEAMSALGELVAGEPEAADEVAAIPFDAEGTPAVPRSRAPPGFRTPSTPPDRRARLYIRGSTVCAAIHSSSVC